MVAARLDNGLKRADVLARLGGDEFVIALTDISSREQAVKAAHRVINAFKEPLLINGDQIFISLSGGISIYPEDGRELEELIKNADYAMYQAKREQKDLEVSGEEK
jgi:diguanylate cyclase (GGDEF)-like protein